MVHNFCFVRGCSSKYYPGCGIPFHGMPKNVELRTKWSEMVPGDLHPRSLICNLHFKPEDYTKAQKKLKPGVIPTIFPKSPNEKPNPNLSECSDEAAPRGELVACRVCLAADGRLYAIRGSGLEDSLAALTGVALSTEKSYPRHLCVFCLAKLSKFAAFRDSCQRSTALLQTLRAMGRLKMEAFNQMSRQLKVNLTVSKVFQCETVPLLEITPPFKTEEKPNLHEEGEFTEVEKLESEDITKQDAGDDDGEGFIYTFEPLVQEREMPKIKLSTKNLQYTKDEMETESPGTLPELDNRADTVEKKIESRNITKQDASDGDSERFICTFEPLVQLREISKPKWSTNNPQCTKDEMETESPGALSEPDDSADAVEKNGAALKTEFELAFEKKYNFDIKVLSKEEQKQNLERNRNSNSAHSCDVCGKGHSAESALRRHQTYYHDPSFPFECDVCRCRFRRRRELHRHRELHRAVLTCRQCGYVCFNRPRAKEHCSTHKGTKYTCPHCGLVFDRQYSYHGHVRLEHPDKNEACDECGETFNGRAGLMIHKAVRHWTHDEANIDTKCTVCKVKFSTAEALLKHEELSAGAAHALWPCAACGESCASDAARAAHAAETHPPGQLHCQECDKTFSDSASFAVHTERKHQKARGRHRALGARPPRGPKGTLVCEICGKVSSCRATLEYHMNGHLGLKPFQCPHCPKAFPSKNKLRIHMRTHTGEHPYQCEQCPLTFAYRSNFQRHVKCVHLRMQATCDKCGKTMKAVSLASHVRAVHMNIPYVRRKRDRTKKLARVTKS